MRILDRLLNKKNKFVQPQIIVEESEKKYDFQEIGVIFPTDRSVSSTWFADPKSSTGRRYRVQINGEMGTVEGSGETMEMAIKQANKEYDKKIK
jgi:hypothetical protein